MKVTKDIPVDSTDQTPSKLSSTSSDSGVLHGRDVSKNDRSNSRCALIMYISGLALTALVIAFISIAGFAYNIKKAIEADSWAGPNDYIAVTAAVTIIAVVLSVRNCLNTRERSIF